MRCDAATLDRYWRSCDTGVREDRSGASKWYRRLIHTMLASGASSAEIVERTGLTDDDVAAAAEDLANFLHEQARPAGAATEINLDTLTRFWHATSLSTTDSIDLDAGRRRHVEVMLAAGRPVNAIMNDTGVRRRVVVAVHAELLRFLHEPVDRLPAAA